MTEKQAAAGDAMRLSGADEPGVEDSEHRCPCVADNRRQAPEDQY